ncbi:phosphoribosylaminoimidazole carboxylase [Malassezia yamatoensis]|uniref:Phosphoribosylaminoimidazole carboxylase n=1 Tax=Malassezia yamatoensis TaxID=253288 RepID=A0AAJ6CGC8_9BASI|nr:phosphoribosylaminoimidazole carboxylase [Malassezia yamatoensis]
MDSTVVGVLGGGQLGRMFAEAAARLNIQVRFLDVGDNAPAKQITNVPASIKGPQHVDGAFSDASKIVELAKQVDVLTVEIEHVDADQLQNVLDEKLVKAVHPSPSTIKLIQDKYQQKLHLQQRNLPVVDFVAVEDGNVDAVIQRFGLPLMLKSRTEAYDGKGNYVLRSRDDIPAALEELGGGKRELYAEKWAPFAKEVAVMVVRSVQGEVRAYTAVETVHEDSICHRVYAPLRDSIPGLDQQARKVAENAVETFSGAGIFGVELFLMEDGKLLINEIAPRPHNSGHFTQEASDTTQFENHLRAVVGLPLGSTALKVPAAAMLNILGLADLDKDPDAITKTFAVAKRSLSVPGTSVHLYGKSGCRVGRKMGHINIVGDSDAIVADRMEVLLNELKIAKDSAKSGKAWDSDAAEARAKSEEPTDTSSAGFSHAHPLVGVIMGSDSDLPVMLPAARILRDFGIPFELTIVSAHRTPDRMKKYANDARARGLRVIIAGAGGAAHLPGMVAAQTSLPVIGVPVKGSTLDGVDSLHSIVQMPRGVPVASVAINNSMNAGLLAIRMLGTGIPAYLDKLDAYQQKIEQEVLAKVQRLEQEAWNYS